MRFNLNNPPKIAGVLPEMVTLGVLPETLTRWSDKDIYCYFDLSNKLSTNWL